MIFRRVEPSAEYCSLRLLSDEGLWELGLCAYRSGTRLRMGRSGRPPSVLDLCLGSDTEIYFPVIVAVVERLESLPESAAAAESGAAAVAKASPPLLKSPAAAAKQRR